MHPDTLQTLTTLLASPDPAEIQRGLELAEEQLRQACEEDAQQIFDLILPLFYIDPLDLPDHVPVLEKAIAVAASGGPCLIPVMIQSLEAGDVKAQMAIAQALGRMGAAAIDPLINEYRSTCPDPSCRAFLLYALGKVKSPEIVRAAPIAIEAARSTDLELRDTATRAIGKFVESIPAGTLPEETRQAFLRVLRENLADPSPGIRAKAVRSLGKLARYGHLTPQERGELKTIFQRILGEDEHFEWDRAYVVRKEAREALGYVW
jgi:HEAT repeat protein